MSGQLLYGQSYFQIGYNGSIPTGIDSLNFIIDRYNETRSYLDVQMKNVQYLDGITFSYGWYPENFIMGIGYTGAGQKTFAEGMDNTNTLRRRELKVKSRLFDIDLAFGLNRSSKVKVFLGTTFTFGSFVVKSRVAEASEIKKEEWETINDSGSLIFGTGLFLRIASAKGFFIQPYYMFTPGKIFENDVTSVNEEINSATYLNDPTPLKVKNSMFGVKIGIGIYGD